MAMDGCGYACKYILFVFNLIFALMGFALLGLGLWLRLSINTRGIFEMDFLDSSAFVIGVTVLIALGTVMLIVVAFGDYGACNEKRCALQVFSVLLSILISAHIICGVLSYSMRDKLGASIGEFYTSLYGLYLNNGGDPATGVTLTFVHNLLHCCGLTGIKVIEIVQQTCPKPDGFFENILMPNCPEEIATIFYSKAPMVMGIFFGSGALLIVAVVCAGILLKQLKRVNQDVTTYYSTVY